jgi:hypothetical protein
MHTPLNRNISQTGRSAGRWARWSGKVFGVLDGLGVALLTAPLAYWLGTRQKAEFGYILSLVTIGAVLAIMCLRAWINRKLLEIKEAEEKLGKMRELNLENRSQIFQFDLITSATSVRASSPLQPSARERFESWLNLIDKKNQIFFRIGRLVSGMSCIAAGIAIFVITHGERSWGGSALLGTGGLLLGARNMLECFKPRLKRPQKSRSLSTE